MPILSESQVRQATPLDKPYKLYDSGGLYLRVCTRMLPPSRPRPERAGKGNVRQARRADGRRTPGRLHAADQCEEVGTPRPFELTIRLAKIVLGLRRGPCSAREKADYRLTVMLA